jgi:hypothetical protein
MNADAADLNGNDADRRMGVWSRNPHPHSSIRVIAFQIGVICVELVPTPIVARTTAQNLDYGFGFSTRIFCRSVLPFTVITAT